MARKSRKNIPEVVSSATVQTEVADRSGQDCMPEFQWKQKKH